MFNTHIDHLFLPFTQSSKCLKQLYSFVYYLLVRCTSPSIGISPLVPSCFPPQGQFILPIRVAIIIKFDRYLVTATAIFHVLTFYAHCGCGSTMNWASLIPWIISPPVDHCKWFLIYIIVNDLCIALRFYATLFGYKSCWCRFDLQNFIRIGWFLL